MTPEQPTPPTPPPVALCQFCQERPGEARIDTLLVCGQCFDEAASETLRLWRASLHLIQGGYPR